MSTWYRFRSWRIAPRFAAAAAASTAAAALMAAPAYATTNDYGMPSKTFNYVTSGINPTWVQHFDTANIRWNQRVASHIGRDTRSPSTATAAYYRNESWYGLTTTYGAHRDSHRYVKIQMNLQTITRDYFHSTEELVRYSRIFITHELGHALCLADNPNTRQVSIMKYSDWGRTDVPTPYDIADVRRVYR